MGKTLVRRNEMLTAKLDLGEVPIDLADYATTGLRAVAVGPSGSGKTNGGLAVAEQLAAQGWVCVLVDPEGEIEALYGEAVADPGTLAERLRLRDQPIVVVRARTAKDFAPYAEVLARAADAHRKPLFVMVDEGQLFSSPRRRKGGDNAATIDLLNDMLERGRKRALDLFLTAPRCSGSLHRTAFTHKNLTLVGRQEDPAGWSALAPHFRGTSIGYSDLAALAPGEFFILSHRGCERSRLPMAAALKRVALPARAARAVLPTTYSQWARAMCAIPNARLKALTPEVTALLGAVCGLTPQQMLAGERALADELEARA